MKKPKIERSEILRYWGSQVELASRSGLSGSEYCRVNRLNANQFFYWKSELDKRDIKKIENKYIEKSGVESKNFVSELSEEEQFELKINEITLKVPKSIGSQKLVEIIRCLVG